MARAGIPAFEGPIRTKNWRGPRKWNRIAGENNTRYRIFTCSMSDFFHVKADPWRDEAWDIISECQNLDWLILTKRVKQIEKRLPVDWGSGYDNVWLGVTAGCNKSLWRLPILKEIPAKVKFVSAEPLLEAMDFTPHLKWLDWIITGCESGNKDLRRKMDMQWVRDIDKQCKKAGVAHYFKQYYSGTSLFDDGMLDGKVVQEFPS